MRLALSGIVSEQYTATIPGMVNISNSATPMPEAFGLRIQHGGLIPTT